MIQSSILRRVGVDTPGRVQHTLPELQARTSEAGKLDHRSSIFQIVGKYI
jgi:hypothetical protein